MNLRPSGYEPDELPDCSTPHRKSRPLYLVVPLMQVEQSHLPFSIRGAAPPSALLQGSLTKL